MCVCMHVSACIQAAKLLTVKTKETRVVQQKAINVRRLTFIKY